MQPPQSHGDTLKLHVRGKPAGGNALLDRFGPDPAQIHNLVHVDEAPRSLGKAAQDQVRRVPADTGRRRYRQHLEGGVAQPVPIEFQPRVDDTWSGQPLCLDGLFNFRSNI
jgi:hypothetical protein